ncbi:hypothetical protein ACKVWC_005844 [Pyricularia oryzae]
MQSSDKTRRKSTPEKHLSGRLADAEIAERAQGRRGGDAGVGHAEALEPEQAGRLAVESGRVEHARAGVKERIARRPGAAEHDAVDDVRQRLDAGIVDGDDEGGLRRAGCGPIDGVEELRVAG